MKPALAPCLPLLLAAACAASHPKAPPPAAAALAAAPPQVPTEPAPALRLPGDVVPRAYRLDLDARTQAEAFTGTAEIDVELAQPRQTLWLHAKELQVAQVELVQGGKTVAARMLAPGPTDLAAVVLAAPAQPGTATLRFRFSAPYGSHNAGFYKASADGRPYLFTQFEATSARLAFPCFDEPGFKAPLTLALTVNPGDVAAANTPVLREREVAGGRRVEFGPTAPLPTYLYAWTVGPFDVVEAPAIPPSAVRQAPIPLRGLATKGHGAELARALAEAPRLVQVEEAYFGVAYPWQKLDLEAVPDFDAGAMENPGLITFRAEILLQNAHSGVARAKNMVEDLAHELAHQWFGDLVTMRWWDDVWLNESFATWLEHRAAGEVHPEFRIGLAAARASDAAMDEDALASARQIRQPIVTTGDIHDAFDGITYSKGGAVLDMFERHLGAATFQKGIQRYIQAHANGNTTSEDLLRALNEASGQDVAKSMRTFLDQPGVPRVEAALQCGPQGNVLQLAQRRALPRGSPATAAGQWEIPVCARYDAGKSAAVACTLLREPRGVLPLPGKSCPTWVQPNADAGGYYRFTLPGPQLAALGKAKLGDRDRFAVAAALRAGYSASAIPAAEALRALEPFAHDAMPEVAGAYGGIAAEISEDFADESWRPALKKKLEAVYRADFQRLGLQGREGESEATVKRRRDLAHTLARVAESKAVRQPLAALGRKFLGVGQGGTLDPEAVEPELAPLAVLEAILADHALLQPTLARFYAETDEGLRSALLEGLAGLDEPQLAAQVRPLSLDPRTRVNEVLTPYFEQASDSRTRPGAWADFKKHFDTLAKRLDEEIGTYIPFAAGDPCDDAARADIESFFASKAQVVKGMERGVQQELETIHLCAARKEAQAASAKAYFTGKAR